jgi:hypothetical protein
MSFCQNLRQRINWAGVAGPGRMSTVNLVGLLVLTFSLCLAIVVALYDLENALKKLRGWSPPSCFDFG